MLEKKNVGDKLDVKKKNGWIVFERIKKKNILETWGKMLVIITDFFLFSPLVTSIFFPNSVYGVVEGRDCVEKNLNAKVLTVSEKKKKTDARTFLKERCKRWYNLINSVFIRKIVIYNYNKTVCRDIKRKVNSIFSVHRFSASRVISVHWWLVWEVSWLILSFEARI